jgi:hypothetical protein
VNLNPLPNLNLNLELSILLHRHLQNRQALVLFLIGKKEGMRTGTLRKNLQHLARRPKSLGVIGEKVRMKASDRPPEILPSTTKHLKSQKLALKAVLSTLTAIERVKRKSQV